MTPENLQLGRIAVHEIFQRKDGKKLVTPSYAKTLEHLDQDALDAFQIRMIDVLAGEKQSLEMSIVRTDDDSFISRAKTILKSSDDEFLKYSQKVAMMLAQAQLGRQIPGGVVIVFDGKVGAPEKHFVAVVKAETHAAFRRTPKDGETIVEFISKIFLSPTTRLYKLGFLVCDDQNAVNLKGWKAFVFDSNISPSNREHAAQYFYEAFLGCALPEDGAYETARFFNLTKAFIGKSDMSPDDKGRAMDSLHVYIRNDQAPTFTYNEYADRHLPEGVRDVFSNYMEQKKFRKTAIIRDTSQMGNRLKRRRLQFGTEIELSASPEALKQKVDISTIDGKDIKGNPIKWTKVIIKDSYKGEK